MVLVNKCRADKGVIPRNRNSDSPMVGINKAQQRAAGNDLIVINNLAVISCIDFAQLLIGTAQNRGDPVGMWVRDQ